MIEYIIAAKEHLTEILELYKQLFPDEEPSNKILKKNKSEKIYTKILDIL